MATVSEAAERVPLRYSNVAVTLHWLIVAVLLTQVAVGFAFHRFLEQGPERAMVFTWHKTLGATILVLTLIRLWYRLRNPPPPYPPDMPDWRRIAAVWSHRLLYFLLIALPLTGLTAVSDAPGATTPLIGGIPLPTVPGIDEATGDLSGDVHVLLVWTTIALLVLHIGAAFYEQFFARAGVAYRMPPFRARDGGPAVIGQGSDSEVGYTR